MLSYFCKSLNNNENSHHISSVLECPAGDPYSNLWGLQKFQAFAVSEGEYSFKFYYTFTS